MSPRLLAPLSAFLLGAAIVFFLRPETPREPASAPVVASPSEPTPTSKPADATQAADIPQATAPAPALPPPAPPSASSAPGPGPSPAQAASTRETHLARIETAITTPGPESLALLASYLTHSDAELRAFAREGLVQTGLPEAVPLLREAAGKTKDPREAITLLDAADFLSLPTLPPTGDGARQRTKATAPEQTRPPGRPASFHP